MANASHKEEMHNSTQVGPRESKKSHKGGGQAYHYEGERGRTDEGAFSRDCKLILFFLSLSPTSFISQLQGRQSTGQNKINQ